MNAQANRSLASAAVPPEYVGVWRRTLLRTPSLEDTSSRVYWLQTSSWHADIRVPSGRPACTGRASLAEIERWELIGLASQQGFAGITVVEGDTCRWLRHHDFQPPSGANDIGRMVFETPDRVLEYGVEAEYFEVWERMPGSAGDSFAAVLSENPLVRLLRAGRFAMRVRPRREPLPRSSALAELAAQSNEDALRRMLDFEISFATRTPGGTWETTLSTLPWLEGRALEPAARLAR